MSKIILQFLLILLIFSGGAFAQEKTWQTYSPESGEWSVLAPAKLNADDEALETPSKQGSYTYGNSERFYAILYQENPKWLKTIWTPFIGSHYKKVTKGFVKNSKGELLKDQKFSEGKISGREVYIKVPDGRDLGLENQLKTRYRIQRIRMFFHGSRFYVLMALLPESEIGTAETDKFFNSFILK